MGYLASITGFVQPAATCAMGILQEYAPIVMTMYAVKKSAEYLAPGIISKSTQYAKGGAIGVRDIAINNTKSGVALIKSESENWGIAPWKGLTGGAVGVVGTVAAGAFYALSYPAISMVALPLIGATGLCLYYASSASERLKAHHLEVELKLLNPDPETYNEVKSVLTKVDNIATQRSLRQTVNEFAFDPEDRAEALTILQENLAFNTPTPPLNPNQKSFVENFKILANAASLTSREKLNLLECFRGNFPDSSKWSSAADQVLRISSLQRTFKIYADLLESLAKDTDQIIPSVIRLKIPVNQIDDAVSILKKIPNIERKQLINSIKSLGIPPQHILETIQLIEGMSKDKRENFIQFIQKHISKIPALLMPASLKVLKEYTTNDEFKEFSEKSTEIINGINNNDEVEKTLKYLHKIPKDTRENYVKEIENDQTVNKTSRFQAVEAITSLLDPTILVASAPALVNTHISNDLNSELEINKNDLRKFLNVDAKYLPSDILEKITTNARKNGGLPQFIKDAESHFSFRMNPKKRVQMAEHLAQISPECRKAAKKLTSPFAHFEGKLKIIDAFQGINIEAGNQFYKDTDALIFRGMRSELRATIIKGMSGLTPTQRKALSQKAELLSKNKKSAGTTFLEERKRVLKLEARDPAPRPAFSAPARPLAASLITPAEPVLPIEPTAEEAKIRVHELLRKMVEARAASEIKIALDLLDLNNLEEIVLEEEGGLGDQLIKAVEAAIDLGVPEEEMIAEVKEAFNEAHRI